jgi:peroxiredoxin
MRIKLVFLLVALQGICYAGEIKFRVEGKLSGTLNGKYAYLQVFSNRLQKAQFIQVSIRDKSFVFTGTAKYPDGEYCTARLFIADKPGYTTKDVIPLMQSRNYDYRRFILEQKVIVQIGELLREAEVIDGELNNINSLFEAADGKYLKSIDSITKWYKEQSLKFKNDKETLQKITAMQWQETWRVQDLRTESFIKLVARYPNSLQAMQTFQFLVISNKHQRSKYQDALLETWNNFPGDVKNKKKIKEIYATLVKPSDELKLKPGNAIPDNTFNNDDGGSISLKNYRGQYLFLDFWTSWCSPCKGEHYYMKKAFNRFSTKNFTILQVSLDDKKEKWLKAIAEESLPWTNLRFIKGWDKEMEQLFDIRGVPTNYLIDPQGKIIARDLRGEELEKKLAEIFK